MPKSNLVGYWGRSILIFLRNHHTDFHYGCTYTGLPEINEYSSHSTSLPDHLLCLPFLSGPSFIGSHKSSPPNFLPLISSSQSSSLAHVPLEPAGHSSQRSNWANCRSFPFSPLLQICSPSLIPSLVLGHLLQPLLLPFSISSGSHRSSLPHFLPQAHDFIQTSNFSTS